MNKPTKIPAVIALLAVLLLDPGVQAQPPLDLTPHRSFNYATAHSQPAPLRFGWSFWLSFNFCQL